MTVTVLNNYDQFQEVLKSGKPVVIDFWATWCGPCKIIGPIFEKFSNAEDSSGVGFYKVDADVQEAIAKDAQIKTLPSFVYYKDGVPVERVLGAQPSKLDALVRQAVAASKVKQEPVPSVEQATPPVSAEQVAPPANAEQTAK